MAPVSCCMTPLKSRIRTGRNGWAAAHRFGERSEPECIYVRIIKKFMDTVISKIADRHGTRGTETLLCLQAPFLIFRRVDRICQVLNVGRTEVRIRLLDLSKSLTRGKSFHKC